MLGCVSAHVCEGVCVCLTVVVRSVCKRVCAHACVNVSVCVCLFDSVACWSVCAHSTGADLCPTHRYKQTPFGEDVSTYRPAEFLAYISLSNMKEGGLHLRILTTRFAVFFLTLKCNYLNRRKGFGIGFLF
jgi:hypothetical protein